MAKEDAESISAHAADLFSSTLVAHRPAAGEDDRAALGKHSGNSHESRYGGQSFDREQSSGVNSQIPIPGLYEKRTTLAATR